MRSFRDWRRLLLPVVGFLWRVLCSDCRFRNGSRKGEERGRLYVSLLVCRAPIRGGFRGDTLGEEEANGMGNGK